MAKKKKQKDNSLKVLGYVCRPGRGKITPALWVHEDLADEPFFEEEVLYRVEDGWAVYLRGYECFDTSINQINMYFAGGRIIKNLAEIRIEGAMTESYSDTMHFIIHIDDKDCQAEEVKKAKEYFGY